MLVADIIRGKGGDIVTVAPTATVHEAVNQLAEHNIGALVVATADGTVAGIISERDIVRSLARLSEDTMSMAVGELMTSDVFTCAPEDNTGHLMGLMTEKRIRHLPVIENQKLSGIVSIGDVVKDRVRELEEERRHLEEYITPGSR